MTETEKLKPCPFCGASDVRVIITCFGHEFICDSCGLHAHFHDVVRTSPMHYASMNVVREEADKRWNRRSES
jgi:hypothetical protein